MLVTLEEVKTYLGIPLINTDDDVFITSEISYISDVVEGYCGRKFEQNSYEQTFYKDESINTLKEIYLYHYPVISITDILIDGVTLDVSQYRKNTETGKIKSIYSDWFNLGETISVTFDAGFAVIPSVIKYACYGIIEERYNKKKSGVALNFGTDVQRISVAGVMSIDFDYTLENNDRAKRYGSIIGNHANMLDNYRSERVVIGTLTEKYVS